LAPERETPGEGAAPPAGEPVHLPGPSLLPVVTAAGIALAIVGVVLSFAVTAIGVLITVVAVWRWVRETREDISDLPLEH
jgi:membrane protein implicated in regulation of membrane protease activity